MQTKFETATITDLLHITRGAQIRCVQLCRWLNFCVMAPTIL